MKEKIKEIYNLVFGKELGVLPGNLAFSFFLALIPMLTLIFFFLTQFNLPIDIIQNFLTETFISLRKLENEVLQELYKGQITIGAITNPIKVSIKQFYGIEINDFAVTVAKTNVPSLSLMYTLSPTLKCSSFIYNHLPYNTYCITIKSQSQH